jgi:hypothetical protein
VNERVSVIGTQTTIFSIQFMFSPHQLLHFLHKKHSCLCCQKLKLHHKVAMDEGASVVKLSCSTHSRALELICHTCKHAICIDCVVSSCRSHRFDKAQDAVVNAMEGVKQTSTQLTRNAGMINEALVKTDRVFNGELLDLRSSNDDK